MSLSRTMMSRKMVAENLELFAEDVDRYIEDKRKQKVPQTVIENHKNQLAKVREVAKQVSYPSTIFYPDEKTDIVGLNKEELSAQKAEVWKLWLSGGERRTL